jgi:hypothetical protein
MAISNMQQARQLRAGGGIMALREPRQGYFLGKAVKKIGRGLKKVLKSPLGLAAVGTGLNMFGPTKGFLTGTGKEGFNKLGLLGRLKSGEGFLGGVGNIFRKDGEAGNKFSMGRLGLGALGLAAVTAPYLQKPEEIEEEESFSITPGSISDIRTMARFRDPSLAFMPQSRYVQPNFYAADGGIAKLSMGGGAGQQQMMQALQAEYMKYRQNGGTMPFEQYAKMVMQQRQGQPQMAANGGRIGYQMGGPTDDVMVENVDTQEVVSNPDPVAELNMLAIEVFGKSYDKLNEREQEALMNFISKNPEEEVIDTDETMVENRVMANSGGMIDYMSSANPMARSYIMEDTDIVNMYRPSGDRQMAAEGGIMDLGGMEKDYRAEGGFVPIGGKEKADDVPARLSKNEFVFTADAVRNAGGGDIDEGAAVMERLMDNLEQGGKVSEDSQGGNPAQEMFNTAQQLESRIA